MNLEPFTGQGSTPSRRRLWDKVTQAVIASQKIEGSNVSVQEYQGQGTLISTQDDRGRAAIGACCVEGECSQTTESDCEGVWQGAGVPCDDDLCSSGGNGSDTTGACCVGANCHIYTPTGCANAGGEFQGLNTNCSPNPCGGTGRCCFEDGHCEDLSEEDCTTASGTFLPGSCDDNECTCCNLTLAEGLFPPFEDEDGNCWTEQTCSGSGFGGEMVPCDSLFLDSVGRCCPGPVECARATWNPITCELTGSGDCNDCVEGTANAVENPYVPCVPELSPPP